MSQNTSSYSKYSCNSKPSSYKDKLPHKLKLAYSQDPTMTAEFTRKRLAGTKAGEHFERTRSLSQEHRLSYAASGDGSSRSSETQSGQK